MVTLPTKGAKLLPLAENLNFSTMTAPYVFKFSAQASNLVPFIGNEAKVKMPSEIKPSLEETGRLGKSSNVS